MNAKTVFETTPKTDDLADLISLAILLTGNEWVNVYFCDESYWHTPTVYRDLVMRLETSKSPITTSPDELFETRRSLILKEPGGRKKHSQLWMIFDMLWDSEIVKGFADAVRFDEQQRRRNRTEQLAPDNLGTQSANCDLMKLKTDLADPDDIDIDLDAYAETKLLIPIRVEGEQEKPVDGEQEKKCDDIVQVTPSRVAITAILSVLVHEGYLSVGGGGLIPTDKLRNWLSEGYDP
jgi:hypothetical protein